MNRILYIVLLIFIVVPLYADTTSVINTNPKLFPKTQKPSEQLADSIMQLVIANARTYERTISKSEAEIYIKGRAEILRNNKLIHFAHHLFPVNRKTKDMVFEIVSHSRYEAPNNYVHEFEALNGSHIPNYKKQQEFLQFLNLNVYSATAYKEGFIMPVARKSYRYYTFNLEETREVDGIKIYKIRFLPKQWSQKLVSGDLYIVDKNWTVDRIDLSGRYAFADFHMQMSFGRDFRRFILPQQATLAIRYNVLGNTVVSTYHAGFDYKAVEWIEEDNEPRRRTSLDLSNYFILSSDTVPIVTDTVYWEKKRDIPLTTDEEILYQIRDEKQAQQKDTTTEERFLAITEKLTNSLKYNNETMRFRYSGILNPFQLGYSKRYGVSYKQKIRFVKTFENDKQLRVRPEVGYLFKQKELFFRVPIDWEYLPQKRGTISISAGNDNNSYSSEIMEDINHMLKDSTINFEDLNLRYFRHYYVDLRHSIELVNGLEVYAGMSYHRRLAVKDKNRINDETDDEITDWLNDKYNDFTPIVGISYTPRQYYRMDGKRKEYVFSRYPTFTFELARGIPGVMGSTGNYTRFEADLHQSIQIRLLRRLNYRVSAGMYTLQKSTYFADFQYFRRRYFPDSWTDQIGGVFNTLKSEYYNASDKYFQAHFMYQSPFIFFQIFQKEASKHVFYERFYASQLWTPVLSSYTELGYGIGNHIFNVGVFVGFKQLEYQSVGFKFAFELFQ